MDSYSDNHNDVESNGSRNTERRSIRFKILPLNVDNKDDGDKSTQLTSSSLMDSSDEAKCGCCRWCNSFRLTLISNIFFILASTLYMWLAVDDYNWAVQAQQTPEFVIHGDDDWTWAQHQKNVENNGGGRFLGAYNITEQQIDSYLPNMLNVERNDRERHLSEWDDYWWNELPLEIQRAAATLGYTESLWDCGGAPYTDELAWSELSPPQQKAAGKFGFNRQNWDSDGYDTENDSTYNDNSVIASIANTGSGRSGSGDRDRGSHDDNDNKNDDEDNNDDSNNDNENNDHDHVRGHHYDHEVDHHYDHEADNDNYNDSDEDEGISSYYNNNNNVANGDSINNMNSINKDDYQEESDTGNNSNNGGNNVSGRAEGLGNMHSDGRSQNSDDAERNVTAILNVVHSDGDYSSVGANVEIEDESEDDGDLYTLFSGYASNNNEVSTYENPLYESNNEGNSGVSVIPEPFQDEPLYEANVNDDTRGEISGDRDDDDDDDTLKHQDDDNVIHGTANWDDYDWFELPDDIRLAATTLGWSESLWCNGGQAFTDHLHWNELTIQEREAAVTLGYDQVSWDYGGGNGGLIWDDDDYVLHVGGDTFVSRGMLLYVLAALCFVVVGVIDWFRQKNALHVFMVLAGLSGVVSAMLVDQNEFASNIFNSISVHLFLLEAFVVIKHRIAQTNISLLVLCVLGVSDAFFAVGSLMDVVLSFFYFEDEYAYNLHIAWLDIVGAFLWLLCPLIYTSVTIYFRITNVKFEV